MEQSHEDILELDFAGFGFEEHEQIFWEVCGTDCEFEDLVDQVGMSADG